MTIQSTDRKAGPFLSGTALPFEFKVFSKEDIAVIYTNAEGVEVVLVLDSDYSVTLNADQDNNPGGTATLTTSIVSGDRANIIGDLGYDQGTDIRNQGGFEPEIIEDALDRATIQIQQLKEITDRTLKIAPGDPRTSDELLSDIFQAEENASSSAAQAAEFSNASDQSRIISQEAALLAQNYVADIVNPIDGVTRFRNVKQLIDSYMPASQCPETILLEKLRSNFDEFAVYYPSSSNGTDWIRILFSNRFNIGNGLKGATRMIAQTIAKLFESTIVPPFAENFTTATQAQTATSTEATADGTFVGTWTAAATNNGVTDVRYSTTVGDTAEFTVVGAERLVLRSTVNSANGGVMAAVIRDSLGNPIASDKYTLELIGGERQIDLRKVTAANNPMFITLADNLPLDDYTVTFTVSANNPVSGRAYIGGVQGYDETAFNATGRQGTWNTSTFSGSSTVTGYYPGAQAIYQITDATRVSWSYGANTVGGVVGFTIFDDAGVEIDAGNYRITDKKIDCYNASTAFKQTVIADGLPVGTYYVHIEILPEKNASSTGPRVYDRGLISFNETIPGVVGVDPFDDLGMPKSLQTADVIPDVYITSGGNHEQATQVKKTSEADSAFEFVGGVHGYESAMSNLVFYKDGEVFDYAGAADLATFTAKEFKITFNTQLGFSTDATNYWAINDFEYRISNAGYWAKVTREVTQPVDVQADYSLMFQVGNQDPAQSGSVRSVDGGFLNWAIDGGGNKTYTTYDNSSNNELYPCIGAAVWSENYAAYGVAISYKLSRLPYELLEEGQTTALSFVQDRTDGTTKYYNRAFKYPASGGRRLEIGDTYTHINNYRAVKGSGFESMFSGF